MGMGIDSKQSFGASDAVGIGAGVVGMGMGLYNAFRNKDGDDRRQIRQQQKLTDMQAKANEEAADRNQERSLAMWNATNYGAQKEHMIEAGLNPGLMYGLSGGGGATTGSGGGESGVSSGQAASAAATESNKIAMGMQLAQMGLMTAQAEKTKAETKNIEAGTTKTGIDTQSGELDLKVKQVTQDETIERIVAESQKAMAEAATAGRENIIGDKTAQDKIRRIQEEAIGAILDNKEATQQIRIKKAEAAIEEFEAKATENGISTKAPWYIKLMSQLYDKVEAVTVEGGNAKSWQSGNLK